MKNWWRNLQPREQWILIACGILILAVLLYRQCWYPYQQYQQRVQQQLKQTQTQLAWMREQAPLLKTKSSSGSQSADLSTPVEQAVSESAKTEQIQILKIEPNSGVVNVYFDGEISYPQFMQWLMKLQHDFSIQVEAIDLAAGKAGFVSVKKLQLNRRDMS